LKTFFQINSRDIQASQTMSSTHQTHNFEKQAFQKQQCRSKKNDEKNKTLRKRRQPPINKPEHSMKKSHKPQASKSPKQTRSYTTLSREIEIIEALREFEINLHYEQMNEYYEARNAFYEEREEQEQERRDDEEREEQEQDARTQGGVVCCCQVARQAYERRWKKEMGQAILEKGINQMKEMWENCDETQQFNSRSQYRITIELI